MGASGTMENDNIGTNTILSFAEWEELNAKIPYSERTFLQQGNYLVGWRNSMPWAWKGMSLAYDKWAEKKWTSEECQSREILKKAWRFGQAYAAKVALGEIKVVLKDEDGNVIPDKYRERLDVEEAADLILTTFF